MSRMGVTLVGDWRKLRHKFDRLSSLGEHMADEVLQECAHKVKDVLHDTVNSGSFTPNTEKTAQNKGHDIPFKETGGFASSDSISVEDITHNGKNGYQIGGNPSKTHTHRASGKRRVDPKTYDEILVINQQGGENLVARQALTIAYDRTRDDVEKIALKALNEWLG